MERRKKGGKEESKKRGKIERRKETSPGGQVDASVMDQFIAKM